MVFGDFGGWLGPNQGGDVFVACFSLSSFLLFFPTPIVSSAGVTGKRWYRRNYRVRKTANYRVRKTANYRVRKTAIYRVRKTAIYRVRKK